MSTTGGDKLMESIRESKARAAQIEATVIEVGFRDTRIATLAAQHEFGGRNVPERPAFRAGVARLDGVIAEQQGGWSGLPDDDDIVELARGMADTIRDSYENFHGKPLSRRQQQRKEGTPGAGRQLVGSEGPKMIGHIGAWVNGNKVDGGDTP